MADIYDRMNSTQLDARAQELGLNLGTFQELANNKERAQALRDAEANQEAAQTAGLEAAQQAPVPTSQEVEEPAPFGGEQPAEDVPGVVEGGQGAAPTDQQSLANAQATVRQMETAEDATRMALVRAQQLASEGQIPRADLDSARAAEDSAGAAVVALAEETNKGRPQGLPFSFGEQVGRLETCPTHFFSSFGV